jgi:hypothetical protein
MGSHCQMLPGYCTKGYSGFDGEDNFSEGRGWRKEYELCDEGIESNYIMVIASYK